MTAAARLRRSITEAVSALRFFLRQHATLRRMLLPWLRPLHDFLRLRPVDGCPEAYRRWVVAYDTLNAAERAAIRAHIATLAPHCVISVIMCVRDTPAAFLREAIASFRAQLYPYWELCIVDDASPSSNVTSILESAASEDRRIRWTRQETSGNVAVATNSAFASATGGWVVLMGHDGTLPEHALYELAAEIAACPDTQVIFTDEDQINEHNFRCNPCFKPDYDPDLLLGQNIFGNLVAYRSDLLHRLGGMRESFASSQDHDLALRAAASVAVAQVRHIPSVLYHRRRVGNLPPFSKPPLAVCADASRRAVQEHLAARGVKADIVPAPLAPHFNRVIWPLPDPAPLVSVIVPTRDRAQLLKRCLDGVLYRTDYPHIEVMIVDNGSTATDALELFAVLAADPRVRVLTIPGPFNYAMLNNRAAAEARGDILLLLNNDVDVIDGSWLREMVSNAVRPDIGAVGAKLIYENGNLQHGGVVLGMGADWVAGHMLIGAPRCSIGPFGLLALSRTAAAVTGACLALRRGLFEEVGGLDAEHLPVAFSDVDLCLRLRENGYRNVWTPFAELYHLESQSRGPDTSGARADRFQREVKFMLARWGTALRSDRCWNPNLSLAAADGSLAWPPRATRPWRIISRSPAA